MTTTETNCEMAPETAKALTGPAASAIMAMLAKRMARRRYARPGGAAQQAAYEVKDDRGETIKLFLPSMRDGGSLTVVHHLGIGTLHSGRILRVPHAVLPDTILLSAPGRRLGQIVDMTTTSIPSLAYARITDVFHTGDNGQTLLFHTDAATTRPTFETS